MTDSIAFSHKGQKIDLPILEGTEGEIAINVGKLRAKTGVITLDEGYLSTGATKSAITFLDGEKGILRYRGYPIEQLAQKSSFLEVSYLLINGNLPNREQLSTWQNDITYHTLIHEDLRIMYQHFPKNAHPMALLSSMIGALSAFYEDSMDPLDELSRQQSTLRVLAKAPTIAAYSYKRSIGQPKIYPRNDLNYIQNFVHMLFATPAEKFNIFEEVVEALEVLLILHADHEQNCSTSTVRLVGSSRANLYASIASGVYALWGPLHGGANQAVLEMLQQIHDDGGDVNKFINLAKDKDSGFRLMGFGHRVYKNFDPRANIIKKTVDSLLAKLNINDPLLEIAKKLEEKALEDPYFKERKLYPNVDFYSGIIYKAIGFPINMFTVLFALGRLPGWIAQWKEMMTAPDARIGRPRQLYTGENIRDYQDIKNRK